MKGPEEHWTVKTPGHKLLRKRQPLTKSCAFQIFAALIGLSFLGSVVLLAKLVAVVDRSKERTLAASTKEEPPPPHFAPRLPYLPPFAAIENEASLANDALAGNPTIAGIAAILNRFLRALHESNLRLAASKTNDADKVRDAYFRLVSQHLVPLDEAYRDRPIFPIREDDSIFVSLAAFRESLLGDTLKSAFGNAARPQKLFVGVVVQNCFGIGGEICKTGRQVVGKDAKGNEIKKMLDAPPDVNGVAEFCTNETYKQYCDGGNIRTFYMNETDAMGPAVARYYASKLWGGETYFVQVDSHLQFAKRWDELYVLDMKLSRSYPKAVLSTYPPGFVNFREKEPFTPGTKLCKCRFSESENNMLRVEMDGKYGGNETIPKKAAFIGAGFFMARAEFLVDVPFDPFIAWCFTGEEITLSMRAWTHGWDIYAPRKNLIGHQYRPVKKYPGLPHYSESVGRLFGRPLMNDRIQRKIHVRIKHMLGYFDPWEMVGRDKSQSEGELLVELERYGLGSTRTREEFLKLHLIDMKAQTCSPIPWCRSGDLE